MLQISNQLETLVWKTKQDFDNLSDDETSRPAIAGGWSRKQILGHLIDSASNNHQRFVRAMLQDEVRLPTYDQEGCVRVAPTPSGVSISGLESHPTRRA